LVPNIKGEEEKKKVISVIIAHDPEREDVSLDELSKQINEQLRTLELQGEIMIETTGSKSGARNKASYRAEGEILVFLDDDVKLRRGFFIEILAPFLDPKVGAVGGVNVAMPEADFWEQISSSMMSSPLLWGRSAARYTPRGGMREADESEIISCCLAVRKKAFDQAGGFPLDVIPCEENVLITRIKWLGWKVIYSPYAIVFHRRAAFPDGYASKMFEYGMGRGIMLRQNLSEGKPRMIWKPSRRWPLYFLGFFIHFGFYFLGVLYGYFIKKKHQEENR